ncbi:universal stress protein [Rhodococcus sp. D-46]|uniref:universal stress protein n=1 Tax=Rhodococcus TaxID=1827 RepID=UPI0013F61668|nr:universal stress protein [Rhodococcus qingshengii]MBX9152132.1 universal stress protein [Rhodococcus qingshengii]NHE67600.1 universal stress protein [Rhodococcus sp. D-46]
MSVNVVVGYDGSPGSNAAIDVGALLFPGAHAWITHLWSPPFASDTMRNRLLARARDVTELTEMVENEGMREAERLVNRGATLARAAGWDATPLAKQSWGGEGLRVAQIAEEVDADLILIGSRGLRGTAAVIGSVSDTIVHYSTRPVVVVPQPMVSSEHAALPDGPVVVGRDGSRGAETAFEMATRLFPDRSLLTVYVDDDLTSPNTASATAGGEEIVRVHPGRGFPGRGAADALCAVAEERNAAVVVVGSRGRSAAREILLGSVAMATLHHCHRPVLVVPTARPVGR